MVHLLEDEDGAPFPEEVQEAHLMAVTSQVAQELRDAADRVALELGNEVGGHTSTYSVRRWLNERAAAVEMGIQ